ncbi:MAG TPA: hypothetical protein VE093_31690 [Polyangiaceae bacterium]|jgi:hypothetical protein|nr:hypothetical protein [Polyangiaceae bacterium]
MTQANQGNPGNVPHGSGSESELDTTGADANEGEGNKTAARRANEAMTEHAQSGRVEPAAQAAKEALDGPEGDELRAAEEQGKLGATPDWGGSNR